MQEQIATLVHRVISSGLDLKERLENGGADVLDIEKEQAALKGHLLSDSAARQYADYGGAGGALDRSVLGASRLGDGNKPGSESFLGIRYALTCWLDEIFILDSPWGDQWNDRKLETALYGTNDRAHAFWDQSRRAEGRSGSDALEVFFLCVMLGFRGNLRDDPQKLQTWVSATQARINKSQGQGLQLPPELEPPSHVPPLHGRERFQQMVYAAAVAFLFLIPIATCLVVLRMVHQ